MKTMRDKIEKLLEQIKRDFPDGCAELDCVFDDCPLNTNENTLKHELCKLLKWQRRHAQATLLTIDE